MPTTSRRQERDAGTGRWVPKGTEDKRPTTTVRETVKVKRDGKKGK